LNHAIVQQAAPDKNQDSQKQLPPAVFEIGLKLNFYNLAPLVSSGNTNIDPYKSMIRAREWENSNQGEQRISV
jgi:hypothetical protein